MDHFDESYGEESNFSGGSADMNLLTDELEEVERSETITEDEENCTSIKSKAKSASQRRGERSGSASKGKESSRSRKKGS